MATSKQVKTPPNPTGKGGFQERPQDRNSGHWKSEESISFQYNKLMRLSPDEFKDYVPKTIAQKIAYKRLNIAITEAGLMDTKEITDRTEGKAAQSIDLTTGGEPMTALVQFVDGE